MSNPCPVSTLPDTHFFCIMAGFDYWKWIKDYAANRNSGSSDEPVTPDPNTTSDGFAKDYYQTLLGNNYNHGTGQSNLWSEWISALAYANQQGIGLDEQLLMLMYGAMKTNAKDDYIQAMFEELLARQKQNDQRAYDKAALQEQRIYDSPTNVLARLMGSGISRDAALQMMSGSAGSGGSAGASLIGSGAGVATNSQVSPTNVLNGSLNKANTIMNVMSTIASFAKMGVSIRQMSAAANAQEIANSVQQQTIDGINAANKVVGAYGNLVTNGTLSHDDLLGIKNADQLLQYALDHKDTNGFKHLFEDGTFDMVYSNSYGRKALAEMWRDMLDTRSQGTQLDQELNAKDNFLTLQNMSKIDFINKINQGVLNNQHLQNMLYQDVIDLLDGAVQLEIDGEVLSQERINTLLAGYEQHAAQINDQILTGVYETPDEDGKTGVYYATMQELNDLYKYCVVSSTERSAMTDEWVANYKRAYFEDGRGILLSLLLQNAYKEGSLDIFTDVDHSPHGLPMPGQGSFTTNTAGDAVILVNQTPLLQGVRLIRNAADEGAFDSGSESTARKGLRGARNASRAGRVMRKAIQMIPK